MFLVFGSEKKKINVQKLPVKCFVFHMTKKSMSVIEQFLNIYSSSGLFGL